MRDVAYIGRLLLAGWISACCFSSIVMADARPHVLFILADDLAWSDLACYGHPWHETPHLDQLSADGLRFTDAYAAAPICSASRASILTGKTPARLNFEFVTKDKPGRQQLRPMQTLRTPPYTLDLPLAERTIAERLQEAGYTTAFFGKWHLNAHYQGYLGWSPTHGPLQQGFAVATEGFGSHPYSYRQSGKPAQIVETNQFPVDDVTDRASAFLRQQHSSPFFLMVSHFYVHTPVDSPCSWLLEKYESRIPGTTPNRAKRLAYAAFVETLDHYVGQLLWQLDAAGLRENTLVVFTSDNGGHPEYTANSPLRGSKWNLYEGGIRVPLLIRWPGQVPAGRITRTPVVGYDLLPTFMATANVPAQKADGLDGVSLLSVIRDPVRSLDRSLYWHFPYYHPETGYTTVREHIGVDDFAISKTRPHSAVRHGVYKLLRFYEGGQRELYDLAQDVGEQQDLCEKSAVVADQLERDLTDYLESVSARMPEPRGPQSKE